MKKLLAMLLVMTATLMSCDKAPLPDYTVEGKWLWSPSEDRADANTMWELSDGNIYTYYCITCTGTSADNDVYWNSLDSTDRLPAVESYTFDGDSLVWNGNSLGVIIFECDGGKLETASGMKLWRLSSNCQ